MAQDIADAVVAEAGNPETVCCRRKLAEAESRVLRDRILKVVQRFSPAQQRADTNIELLQLSETDAARVFVRLESTEREHSGQFERLLKEKSDIAVQLKEMDRDTRQASLSDNERDLFSQLQTEIESNATQLGRKKEEVRMADEDLVDLEDKISTREKELDVLYQKHAGSKEQEFFLKQCDALVNLLAEYVDQLRRAKIGMSSLKNLRHWFRKAILPALFTLQRLGLVLGARKTILRDRLCGGKWLLVICVRSIERKPWSYQCRQEMVSRFAGLTLLSGCKDWGDQHE